MAFIEFNTRNHLPGERADAVRETCAALANMAPDISGGDGLEMSMRIRLLPGVSIASVESSALSVSRSPRQLADGNDDVLLFLNPADAPRAPRQGGWVLRQRGEMPCTGGPGYVGLNEQAGRIDFHGARASVLLIAFARQHVLPHVADVDRALRHSLPDTLALRLLARQASALARPVGDGAEVGDDERVRMGQQLLDLGVLALGAKPQARAAASARGLRQARLKAIQADLRVNAWRGDLSLEWVAQRHGISARYVRALFEHDGAVFSDYVLEQRLQRAFGRLADPQHAQSQISAIAYDAGFNNLSWFYRAFRQRFAMAPGDVRQLHAQEGLPA
ncbi:helix-turn-helix domain-containing protein [Pulveribacter sp.]|uniref:helix-turn-helix transcriptional regulator n=1 Tax=Pulveribacter sp. TaxID=2678893 RepID=UPI0028A06EEA|nr:helix-turn-helix domain-containing protein [Pulveribacter sp.]